MLSLMISARVRPCPVLITSSSSPLRQGLKTLTSNPVSFTFTPTKTNPFLMKQTKMYPLTAACGEGHEEALSKDEEEEMKRRDLELRLRKGLIKKVCCILASQLLFGVVVYAVAKIHPPITAFFKKNLLYLYGPVIIGTFFCIPMMLFPKKSFLNVALLLLSTVGMLVPVAVSIPDRHLVGLNERMVLAALLSTLATVASLTKFTFWASKKGKDKALNQLEP